jgi:hypothetical protein
MKISSGARLWLTHPRLTSRRQLWDLIVEQYSFIDDRGLADDFRQWLLDQIEDHDLADELRQWSADQSGARKPSADDTTTAS